MSLMPTFDVAAVVEIAIVVNHIAVQSKCISEISTAA